MSRPAATLTGFIAVALWALLALFTSASGAVPPLQLAAMSFAIGGLSGMMTWIWRPQGPHALRQSSQPSPQGNVCASTTS